MLNPLSEPVRNFIKECQENNLALYEGLSKKYHLQTDSFVSILQDIIKLAISKSLKKKLTKFHQFILKHIKLSNAKFNYYIRLLHWSLSDVEIEQKRRTVNIKHLHYSEQEISCPEIFICFGNKNEKIQRALLDTGAQASLIGLQDLLKLGYSESKIERTEKYNLRSSSEL